VSRTGETVVTASHDKSLRTWEVGDDLVFLEEEREKELETLYDRNMAENLDRDFRDGEMDTEGDEVAVASKQTVDTLTHGEKIMEALELSIIDLEVMQAYEIEREKNPKLAPPQRNPLFLALGNISAEQHILNTLQKIPTPALNDALLVLPFSILPNLFTFLALFMQRRMNPSLAWRICYFLLQVHMKQIIASRQLKPLLESVLGAYESWQDDERSVLGFNLAGLGIMAREAAEREKGDDGFVGDVEEDEDVIREGKGKRKRAFASLA
jgi:U3 small nucleolar RNA-associated protein 12